MPHIIKVIYPYYLKLATQKDIKILRDTLACYLAISPTRLTPATEMLPTEYG